MSCDNNLFHSDIKQEYTGQSLIFPKRYKCFSFPIRFLLLLVGLLGSLGGLALHHLDGGSLDDSDSHGLPHVTDSEPERVFRPGKETVVMTHLPRGGKSVKGSTHMGLLGVSLTMAASPDLMNLGLSSTDLPVRRSTFSLISAN